MTVRKLDTKSGHKDAVELSLQESVVFDHVLPVGVECFDERKAWVLRSSLGQCAAFCRF